MNLSQMSLLDGTMLWFLNTILMERLQSNMPTKPQNEYVNLNAVEWKHTRKGQRPFLPLSSFSTQEDSLSSLHTVKGFTDYLSVSSSNISEHHSLLSDLSTYSQNLDLTHRPDKCISVIFDGNVGFNQLLLLA